MHSHPSAIMSEMRCENIYSSVTAAAAVKAHFDFRQQIFDQSVHLSCDWCG